MAEEITGFTAKRYHLLQLTERAVMAVPGKNIYPLLSNFQVVFGDGRIRVTATDMELTVISESELVVCQGSGTVLMPAKRLLEILRAGDVDVRITDSKDQGRPEADISAGRASWSLVLQPDEDYPMLPDVGKVSWTNVKRRDVLWGLTMVRKAASRDGTNPRLMAVSISGGKMVAASHVRLHRVIIPDVSLPDIQIPVGAVDDLVKLLAASQLEYIGIGEEEHVLAFRIGSDVFMAGKLASDYPDMEQKLLSGPLTANKEELRVDKGDLVAAIRRVRITADETTAAIGLRLVPGSLRVISRDTNSNTAYEEIPAQWTHKQRLVVVNHEYLSDLIGLADGPQLLFMLGADAGKRRSQLLLLDRDHGTAGVIGQLLQALIE
jgi:DNA polymerase III subunit beta